MDLRTKDGYGTKQPRGQATTLIDLVTRDDQDAQLFPTTANVSRFTRDEGNKTIPFSTVFREFTFKGPADFAQTFIFDLDHNSCGDLLQNLFIQVRLGDWLPDIVRERLRVGLYEFNTGSSTLIQKPLYPLGQNQYFEDPILYYPRPESDPLYPVIVDPDLSHPWTYSNSLGTILLDQATLEMDDQVLEKITGDACNVVSLLFPDLNTQLGASDAIGFRPIPEVKAWSGATSVPTDDMWVTIPLCFSMLRERLTAMFPLVACRTGTVRIRVTLKRFDQIVRSVTGSRTTCTETPVGKDFNMYDVRFPARGKIPLNVSASKTVPMMRNIQLLTQGVFVDGPYREMLLRQPFERPFREIQQFDFNEPLKYVINKSGDDSITVQLPLEANQPIEEIVWFLRRKASVTLNNDWVNYSATLEKDYDPVFSPLEPLLLSAKLQGNGMDIVSQDEAWFRSHISRAHKGGKTSYDSFVYGYSFAKNPGEHDPSGSINASRLSTLRLTLDVKPPRLNTPNSTDSEWEVHVFVFAFQWLRFGNGICNKVFID
jgi:hypothetical protein